MRPLGIQSVPHLQFIVGRHVLWCPPNPPMQAGVVPLHHLGEHVHEHQGVGYDQIAIQAFFLGAVEPFDHRGFGIPVGWKVVNGVFFQDLSKRAIVKFFALIHLQLTQTTRMSRFRRCSKAWPRTGRSCLWAVPPTCTWTTRPTPSTCTVYLHCVWLTAPLPPDWPPMDDRSPTLAHIIIIIIIIIHYCSQAWPTNFQLPLRDQASVITRCSKLQPKTRLLFRNTGHFTNVYQLNPPSAGLKSGMQQMQITESCWITKCISERKDGLSSDVVTKLITQIYDKNHYIWSTCTLTTSPPHWNCFKISLAHNIYLCLFECPAKPQKRATRFKAKAQKSRKILCVLKNNLVITKWHSKFLHSTIPRY